MQEEHSFWSRVSIGIEAGLYCLLPAVVVQIFTTDLLKNGTLTTYLIAASLPACSALGLLMLLSLIPSLVPSSKWVAPMNFTFPIVWCSFCLMAASLVTTESHSIIRQPELARPILFWSQPQAILPIFAIQVCLLSIRIILDRQPEESAKP